MPIEFRCNRCNRLLRTDDNTAGRQAQCPACGALTEIPTASDTAGGSARPPQWGTEFVSPPTIEPGVEGGYAIEAVRRVSGPATALMVTAISGMVIHAVGLMASLAQVNMGMAIQREVVAGIPVVISTTAQLAAQCFELAMGLVVLLGAIRMRHLQSYGFAVTAAVIALIPCISPCCLLGLPFGIWALMVLADARVKSAFRR